MAEQPYKTKVDGDVVTKIKNLFEHIQALKDKVTKNEVQRRDLDAEFQRDKVSLDDSRQELAVLLKHLDPGLVDKMSDHRGCS